MHQLIKEYYQWLRNLISDLSCKELIPKIREEKIVIMNPIKDNVFGDNPKDENKTPVLSKIGCKCSLTCLAII